MGNIKQVWVWESEDFEDGCIFEESYPVPDKLFVEAVTSSRVVVWLDIDFPAVEVWKDQKRIFSSPCAQDIAPPPDTAKALDILNVRRKD